MAAPASDLITAGSGSNAIYGGAGTGKTIMGGSGHSTIWGSDRRP